MAVPRQVIQWNKQAIVPGGVVNITNNVWAKSTNGSYSPVNTAEAFFEWNRNGPVNMSRNIYFYDPALDGPLWSSWHGPAATSGFQNVAMEHNLYVDTRSQRGSAGVFGNNSTGGDKAAATPFPGNASLRAWQKGGHDSSSAGAINTGGAGWSWAAMKGGGGGAAGAALRIQPLQLDDVGPDWSNLVPSTA